MKDQLGALSWGKDGEIGFGGLVFWGLGFILFYFQFSNVAIDFLYICRYTHLHGFGYLNNK